MAEESKAIEKFDPSTLMDGVKNRIKATFVSLIPDDQWEVMVKKTADDFFTQKDRSYYNNKTYQSDFDIVIRQVLEEKAKETIKEMLNSPKYQTMWDANRVILSDELNKQLVEAAPQMMANIMANMVQNVLSSLRH